MLTLKGSQIFVRWKRHYFYFFSDGHSNSVARVVLMVGHVRAGGGGAPPEHFSHAFRCHF